MLLTMCVRFPRFISTVILNDLPTAHLSKHNIFQFNSREAVDSNTTFSRTHWTGRKHSKVFKANDEGELYELRSDLEHQKLKELEQKTKPYFNKNNQQAQNQNVHSFGGIDFVTLKDEDPTFR